MFHSFSIQFECEFFKKRKRRRRATHIHTFYPLLAAASAFDGVAALISVALFLTPARVDTRILQIKYSKRDTVNEARWQLH